jgi:DUF2075 family protein
MTDSSTVQDIPSAWDDSIQHFLSIPQAEWLATLQEDHLKRQHEPANVSQLVAWRNCFRALHTNLSLLAESHPNTRAWHIIFEYELPRERGRRPDVVILAEDTILILEFKDFAMPLQAHIDQVAAYARDVHYYHAASHNRTVIPILVLTRSTVPPSARDGIHIVAPSSLPPLLASLVPLSSKDRINPTVWLQADYAPLPSLISAARTIFNHEPLPQIRHAHSAGIPETIATLTNIAQQAQANNELHLALVTGVPGAGKTLVGIQFVYTSHFSDSDTARTAVLLSGNGPLVKVLQHALRSSVFVQDVHGFLRQYGGDQTRQPEEHIWVYDEAQRAWDAARVQEKRGHGTSEPEDFLLIGERMQSWALIVGLIGEGQEIHVGEEAGLRQWDAAIHAMRKPWIVHCPSKIASIFTSAKRVLPDDYLDLTISLRTHVAEQVPLWIRQLLDGQISAAATTAHSIRAQGFDMYVTRDLDNAKQYVRERYQEQHDKRFGLLASSKAKNLPKYGIQNDWSFTKNLREGPWYNDPPSSIKSCCQLHDVATEFSSQGLELDFPLISWGSDLTWQNNRWISPPQPRSQAHNPHQLRVNSYRVLLSRGRDGFVIFVPNEPAMNSTYETLISASVLPLQP